MSTAGLSIAKCLNEISTRLTDATATATAIASAAITCDESGSEREAFRIAMDLDGLLHQVTTLHGAMCLLNGMPRTHKRSAPA